MPEPKLDNFQIQKPPQDNFGEHPLPAKPEYTEAEQIKLQPLMDMKREWEKMMADVLKYDVNEYDQLKVRMLTLANTLRLAETSTPNEKAYSQKIYDDTTHWIDHSNL